MTESTRLRILGVVAPADAERLARATERHHSLRDVLDWCLAQAPPLLRAGAVDQDEFTRDVVIPIRSDLVLVYDAT